MWPYLRPYGWRMATVALAMIFSSLTTLSIGPGIGLLIDSGALTAGGDQWRLTVTVILTLALLLAGATWVRYYNVSWLGERVSADLRNRVFRHLVGLHPGFFEKHSAGDLQSRFTADTTVLQSAIGSSVSIALRNLVMMVGGVLYLLWLNPSLTLVVALLLPIMLLPVLLLARRVKRLSERTQQKVGAVGSELGEVARNIKTVQAFNRQSYHHERFRQRVEQSFGAAIDTIRQRARITAAVIFMAMGSLAVLVVLGGRAVAAGDSSTGDLVAFMFVAFVVAGAVAMLSETLNELLRAAGAAARLTELLATVGELPAISVDEPAARAARGQGDLQIRDLRFHYPQRPQIAVLDGFSLQARKGELTALVGFSGAGKSTLFDLLLRLYDWQQGEILLDGEDIRQMDLASLRQRIGLVRQDAPMLDATLWENIAYGCAGIGADEIAAAAAMAYADEFISRLPEGMMTEVGEAGIQLSAGQRQRIAIARTLLADPEVLLLDEATSHLDAESESMIQRAVSELSERKTTLVVAHRLATVVKADCLHWVQHGRVVASGTHAELQASSPEYRRLVRMQFAASSASSASGDSTDSSASGNSADSADSADKSPAAEAVGG